MRLFRHRLIVRFRDCDPLGHVNHAVYLTYLEQARFMLWRAQLDFVVPSIGGARQATSKPGFILARAEVDYRAQARYGDELEVRLNLDGIGRTSFTYAYDLVDVATDRQVAAARTVLVLFDYDAQKPVPIDADLRARLATPATESHLT
jgi:acyl-CoA thioester hydrolase